MYAFRRHRERHIVNSFTFCAGGFSHGHNLAVNVVFHPFPLTLPAGPLSDRGQHGFDLFHRAVLQHQLRQRTKGDFFTVGTDGGAVPES